MVGNVFCGLDTSEFYQTLSSDAEGLGEEDSRLGVSLGRDDGRLLALLGFLHEEAGLLRILLRHLLQLYGLRELLAEGEMRDGDVVQDDSKLLRSFR